MRYEGSVYRPPSEAYSLIIQVTIGCAHNTCRFCSMYKDEQFRVRQMSEIMEDLEMARDYYRSVRRIFLADGDALVLSNEKLLIILNKIKELFPECERVGIYAAPKDVLEKTDEELLELKANGIGIIYIGGESGSDQVLSRIEKGATRAELIQSVRKAEAVGLPTSVTFISGMGGKELWREHAVDTGTMISEMEPSYASLLTLMVEPAAPMYEDIQNGSFELLDKEMIMEEAELLLTNINLEKTCVFRSNHASNYLSLKGDLPKDKERMLEEIRYAKSHTQYLKDERFRML